MLGDDERDVLEEQAYVFGTKKLCRTVKAKHFLHISEATDYISVGGGIWEG
jgi:hypothetical protein